MNKMPYFFAVGMILIWFVGYMFFNMGGYFHIVFFAGVVVMVYQILREFNNEADKK